MTTDQTFALDELATLADLPRRTVRYYIQIGLVDRPEGAARGAFYTRRHLEQLLLVRKWQLAGLSLERPVVVIWLGVSYYLAPDTTFGVLGAFSRLAPDSELVMDYILPPGRWTSGMVAMMESMRRLTSESSEPMHGFLEPDALAGQAARLGLTVVSDVGEESRLGFLQGRRDGLALAVLSDDESPARVLTLAVPSRS